MKLVKYGGPYRGVGQNPLRLNFGSRFSILGFQISVFRYWSETAYATNVRFPTGIYCCNPSNSLKIYEIKVKGFN